MKYTYTLVILTYNQSKMVVGAVQAALKQECLAIEILISDDCSNDGTFELVQREIENYTGIHKVILNRNKQNLGLIGHVHRVHEIASGDVIIVAAGDDISLPHRCQKIINCFEENDTLLVCSHAKVVDKNDDEVTAGYLSASLYVGANVTTAALSSALYLGATGAWHRDLYYKYGPIETNAYEDLVLGFRAVLENKYYVIKEKLVVYRLGYGITSSSSEIITEAKFFRHRLGHFIVMCAVLHQRRKDAVTFGHHQNSNLIREINEKIKYFQIRSSYYTIDKRAFFLNLWRHPILAIKCILSEKNYLRKFRYKRKMQLKH